jgi:hypothetical protein
LDELKLLGVFSTNRLLWEKELGQEVKKFTLGNWERWGEEKPELFDAQTIASVSAQRATPTLQSIGARRVHTGALPRGRGGCGREEEEGERREHRSGVDPSQLRGAGGG